MAALLVAAAFAFISPLGGGTLPVVWTFLLVLLCFATGSLANAMFLSRPLRQGAHMVFPAVREPEAIEQAPAEPMKSLPASIGPRAPRSEDDEAPAFAAFSETDGTLEVTVLISGNDGSEQTGGDLAGAGLADLSEEYVVEGIPVQKTSEDIVEPETPAEEEGSDPYPGAVKAKPNGKSPRSGYRIKGNTRSKRYHTMQSPYYERTKASVWFRSAADAERAGFSAWNARTKNSL
ncbi:hypothetical protein [Saccharopolyspora sp. NPDC049426]|uniref:sunset domain-containing protein n=1 Tax=Saccharopolyspora sp. NPDC049426 TaxID=3155652 RepID=UPI003449640B